LYIYISKERGGHEEVKVSELKLHSSNSDTGWGPNWTPCKFLRMLGINLQFQKYLSVILVTEIMVERTNKWHKVVSVDGVHHHWSQPIKSIYNFSFVISNSTEGQ
jgi:hypothetical protein